MLFTGDSNYADVRSTSVPSPFRAVLLSATHARPASGELEGLQRREVHLNIFESLLFKKHLITIIIKQTKLRPLFFFIDFILNIMQPDQAYNKTREQKSKNTI